MPFTLSFFLTLGAVAWFFYGLMIRDLNIAVSPLINIPLQCLMLYHTIKTLNYLPFYRQIPNVLGFIFGVLQMVLYMIYKNPKKAVEPKLHELSEHVVDVLKLSTMVCTELSAVVPQLSTMENDQEIVDELIAKKEIEETKPNKDIDLVSSKIW